MSRIIAGAAKGRRLAMPAHRATRPTTDRVREAAFALLADWAGTAGEPAQSELAGLSFLDLYAGSGAVALEAASRGASPVWAVERDRGTAQVAERNAAQTGLPVKVVTRGVNGFLAAPPRSFDIVWADPPYDLTDAELDAVLAMLGDWLAPRGLVVVERARRSGVPRWPAIMEDSWKRDYGETALHFAMRGEE
ncbi:MAG: 16S rRNA (guanine(966)-N(2))-methyltransferase RsmD [Actinobacteria bacterium]|nr:16S rRNA (guanine(966)-N(2))-methyltransferase RsmD [Actinomycetota bacterium]